jgi:sodium-dependent phosphate cotransporter
MTGSSPPPRAHPSLMVHPVVRLMMVLALLFIFLVAVSGLGDGFKSLGRDFVESFFAASKNPFIGLMIGILATTLVQSSSVTTTMIVGFVASGTLPVAHAIPIVMGANIGTTVTNTVVSLAHMGRPEEFRRAFAVATCHDFFNYISVLVLLPLELMTGFLEKTATALSGFLTGMGGPDYDSPIKELLKTALVPVKAVVRALFESQRLEAIALILLSAITIFVSLMLLVKVMRAAMETRVESLVSSALNRNAVLSIIIGIIVTVMVQSSSITTSLLVPLAGAGMLTLGQAFPITIGANIGTTVTALLAALAATGDNAPAAITIALVHLLFNISGTILIYPVKRIRSIPLTAARTLANIAVRSRKWALIYVFSLFYALPALVAVMNVMLNK